jgi:hypothetical protein
MDVCLFLPACETSTVQPDPEIGLHRLGSRSKCRKCADAGEHSRRGDHWLAAAIRTGLRYLVVGEMYIPPVLVSARRRLSCTGLGTL